MLAALLSGIASQPEPSGPLPLALTPLKKLGQGGEGEVWLARDEKLNRLVVCKRLLNHSRWSPVSMREPALGADPETPFIETSRNVTLGNEMPEPGLPKGTMEEHAASSLAKLSCPGVPQVYGLVTHNHGEWMVQEFVNGVSLHELLTARHQSLGAPLIHSILLNLVESLASIHRAGFIHGDITPANIVITPEGCARFIDFGLMARLGTPVSGEGVAGFTAPESVPGATAHEAFDRFALGCVLYYLLGADPPAHFREADQSALVLQPDCPSVLAPAEEILWASARALTQQNPSLRPDMRVLAATLRTDARHLPAGAGDNLARIVAEIMAAPRPQFTPAECIEVDGSDCHRDFADAIDEARFGSAGAPLLRRSAPNETARDCPPDSTSPKARRRFLLVASIALVGLVAVLSVLEPADKPAKPSYALSVAEFDVAPSMQLPAAVSQRWVANRLDAMAEQHWSSGEDPEHLLELMLSCHEEVCQFTLRHELADHSHWHQETLKFDEDHPNMTAVLDSTIRDLALDVLAF